MQDRFHTFTVQIAKIARAIRRIKAEETEELHLKGTHVSCLYYLYKEERGMTATELCEACDEDKAAVSRSVEYLEEYGYVACKSEKQKRWKSLLVLTDKGREAGRRIADKIDCILAQASEGLTEENRLIFYQSLKLISDNLQKICEKYGE
ncbi:MAG: MarR family transcriptional regulator [Clostridia bacterium]|nr:MarR family transcriptional regulator [Clostridia bacterium]